MADKKQDAVKAARSDEQKYEIAALRNCCGKVFGVTVAAFDGAMYGKSGLYTVAEAKEIISKWLKKPVGGFGKEAR